ncbi:MAG: hypothetical protein L0229_04065, partial [Blastocatellia bacterium]|nr:hypothetical protein [Blastocatellia bacterium]
MRDESTVSLWFSSFILHPSSFQTPLHPLCLRSYVPEANLEDRYLAWLELVVGHGDDRSGLPLFSGRGEPDAASPHALGQDVRGVILRAGQNENFSREERLCGVRRPFSFFRDFFLL